MLRSGDGLEQFLGSPVEVNEEILKTCRDTGSFGALMFELYKETRKLVSLSCSAHYENSANRIALPRNQAICTGLLVRVSKLMEQRRLPRTIRVDSGPEFTLKRLDQWACLNRMVLDFSRPGKPTDNAFIESFNGRFRQECLNENWFLSLEDAEERVESWRRHYNGKRPHSALGNLFPEEFAALAETGD